MIIEIASNLTPNPIIIDTGAPSSGPGISDKALSVIKPSVTVRATPGGAALATWSPKGKPDPDSLLPLALMVGVAVVLGLAVAGWAR